MKSVAGTDGVHGAAPRGAIVGSRLMDFVGLTKPKLNALTVFAVGAGFWAAGGVSNLHTLALTLVGAAMVAAGSSAINQWMERSLDTRMVRTAGRPLPSGRVHPADALAFGVLLGVAGVAVLALVANLLTAALGATCLLSYVAFYTPLKTRTSLNTLVGTLPGALPPVMGVTAAAGSITKEAYFLFAIMIAWQIPHFLSIAWIYRDDYRSAGFVMLPLVEGGEGSTARQTVIHGFLVLAISLLATPLHLAGRTYFFSALVLGSLFLAACVYFAVRRTDASARLLLRASLIHLPLVLTAFALDRLPR